MCKERKWFCSLKKTKTLQHVLDWRPREGTATELILKDDEQKGVFQIRRGVDVFRLKKQVVCCQSTFTPMRSEENIFLWFIYMVYFKLFQNFYSKSLFLRMVLISKFHKRNESQPTFLVYIAFLSPLYYFCWVLLILIHYFFF